MIAYHGTNRELAALDPDAGRGSHPDGLGAWLTEDLATAWDFARDRAASRGGTPIVHEVELSLASPYVVGAFEPLKALVRRHRTAGAARRHLVEQGFDGIVIDRSFPGCPDEARDIIVFDGTSAKIVARLDEPPKPSPHR
jgi:hypothetical protein